MPSVGSGPGLKARSFSFYRLTESLLLSTDGIGRNDIRGSTCDPRDTRCSSLRDLRVARTRTWSGLED